MSEFQSAIPLLLEPLPYHREIISFLKETEPELWKWAASAEVRAETTEEMRFELLKANYRIDETGHPELIQRCAEVAKRLGVTAPITLYQANDSIGANAYLCYLPGEAHIVFTGSILYTLKGAEVDAVLAHELSHYLLWEMDGGDFFIADRLLSSAALVDSPNISHVQSAQRFQLYTEVFADRGSLIGCKDLGMAVGALVKTSTGLPDVSAASYLRQADEIFARKTEKTKGVRHPELFIRARALRLWSEHDAELHSWLTATIEGPMIPGMLDVLERQRLFQLTRSFLEQLLRPKWFQTETVLAHANAFFPNFSPAAIVDDSIITSLLSSSEDLREYICYLLLDFAVIDNSLDDVPLALSLKWSEQLDLTVQFEKLATKELGVTKRQLTKLKNTSQTLLEKAEMFQ